MNLNILLMASVVLLAGCAQKTQHGAIAWRENNTIVHISAHEMKVGDKVILYHKVCKAGGAARMRAGEVACERRNIAGGTVRNVYNEYYIVDFPTGTQFAEGSFVETVK